MSSCHDRSGRRVSYEPAAITPFWSIKARHRKQIQGNFGGRSAGSGIELRFVGIPDGFYSNLLGAICKKFRASGL